MKKLMIAAAIVCAAAFVQAAQVKWSTGKVTGPKSATDGTVTSTLLNKVPGEWIATIYFYDSTGKTQLGTDTASVTVPATGSPTYSDGASWVLATGLTKTDKYSFLADSTDYQAKIIIEGTTADYTASKESALLGFTTGSASGTATWKAGDISGWLNQSWTVSAVPEPTSGLLLLLGVAGLALRRRRA